MNLKFAVGAALAIALGAGAPASAGVFTDDLSRCFVKSTSESDRVTLVQFLFAAIASHPAIKQFASITPEQRADLEQAYVKVIERLILADCRKEAIAAVRNEGANVFSVSGEALGGASMRDLATHPDVQAAFGAVAKYIDKDRWGSFMKEAGTAAAK